MCVICQTVRLVESHAHLTAKLFPKSFRSELALKADIEALHDEIAQLKHENTMSKNLHDIYKSHVS